MIPIQENDFIALYADFPFEVDFSRNKGFSFCMRHFYVKMQTKTEVDGFYVDRNINIIEFSIEIEGSTNYKYWQKWITNQYAQTFIRGRI